MARQRVEARRYGNSIQNEEYVFVSSSGESRKGKLDGGGLKKEQRVPTGFHKVIFPNRPGVYLKKGKDE